MNDRTRAILRLAAAAALASCASTVSAPLPAAPPATPKRPVTEVHHGVAVVDDYRWLEDGADPEVRAWSDAQNARTRAWLDALPGVDAIRARLTEIMASPSVSYRGLRAAGGTLFALKDEPPRQQPLLVAMDAATCDPDGARVVLDLNALDPKGTTSIDWYVPSHDGRLLAVSLSERGSESGTVRVLDAATGEERGERIPRVNGGTAGGSVAWNGDATGFWYTRYPAPGERPAEDLDFFQEVWFHRLGAPAGTDRRELAGELPRIAETQLESSEDGRFVLAEVKNGDGGERGHWLRGEGGRWTQVTKFDEQVVDASLGRDGGLYLLSHRGAPRGAILRTDASAPSLADAAVVVAESAHAIDSFVVTGAHLWVVVQTGGAEEMRIYGRRGTTFDALVSPRLEELSSIDQVLRLRGDDVLVRTQSCTQPAEWTWHHVRDGSWATSPLRALSDTSPVSLSDAECVQEWAVSKDGTRVPMIVVRREGTALDGNNPVLLTGYGGYGISMSPRYRRQLRLWLDHGGVFAVASIRGGGEFGDEWHRAGHLTRKQNVFDDFAACAQRLIDLGYTRSARLAIEGGSNGGLLMGAMITQHPELARAVVCRVGVLDMLRVETTPNGAFNVTEFGTVKDPDQFRALHAYSPVHRVRDGARYPSVLLMTGANDPRVDPYHSRKMAARLQEAGAAVAGANPVLLRTSHSTGHGGGTPLNARIEQDVDVYAFLFHELGMPAPR